ncbi:hypothetical protein K443DRAFT_153033 [Laccaria amethystina LaAM-08-1]|uniref:Uncharacterized protein n=1 Tax=Laccaria amethystina LaAM-08-1 TaxID=1095629 RepID=A0A0C9XSA7_9AGAR|nr:hypothetical protein K443DRAFT_153033 [Laccaria amethystina LaAM-08-1]
MCNLSASFLIQACCNVTTHRMCMMEHSVSPFNVILICLAPAHVFFGRTNGLHFEIGNDRSASLEQLSYILGTRDRARTRATSFIFIIWHMRVFVIQPAPRKCFFATFLVPLWPPLTRQEPFAP